MTVPTDSRELAQALSERLGPAAMNEIITLLECHKHEKHPNRNRT